MTGPDRLANRLNLGIIGINALIRIQKTDDRIQNTEYRTQNTKFGDQPSALCPLPSVFVRGGAGAVEYKSAADRVSLPGRGAAGHGDSDHGRGANPPRGEPGVYLRRRGAGQSR